MSREFVDKVETGDNIGAKDAFATAMVAKVGDALEIKRSEVAKTFVQQRKEMSPEEVKKED